MHFSTHYLISLAVVGGFAFVMQVMISAKVGNRRFSDIIELLAIFGIAAGFGYVTVSIGAITSAFIAAASGACLTHLWHSFSSVGMMEQFKRWLDQHTHFAPAALYDEEPQQLEGRQIETRPGGAVVYDVEPASRDLRGIHFALPDGYDNRGYPVDHEDVMSRRKPFFVA